MAENFEQRIAEDAGDRVRREAIGRLLLFLEERAENAEMEARDINAQAVALRGSDVALDLAYRESELRHHVAELDHWHAIVHEFIRPSRPSTRRDPGRERE